MGKIGDLWVKLGLKKDEYSKGMKEASGEAEGFGAKLKNLAGVATAVWAAIGAAVVKFAKDAISMTQKWGDAWNTTMEGIKGAYASFVRQISSGEGWNNLFANMREAYRVSKEVAAALDEIFERKTSFSYQEAEADKYIAEQTKIMRDASKSDAERKQAAQNIIDKEKELGELKKTIYADEAAAHRRLFLQQTGLNEQQANFLVKEYNQNREIIEQARAYNEERKKLNLLLTSSGGGMGSYQSPLNSQATSRYDEISAKISELDANTSDAVKNVARLTEAYDRGSDELVKNMADADVAVIRVDTDVINATMRANNLLGSLNKAGGTGGDPGREQAERIIQRAQDSAKTELQILDEKYFEEKALLKQYGIDTTALTEEWSRNVNKLIREAFDVDLNDVQLPDLDIAMPEIDDEDFQASIDAILADMNRALEFAEELGQNIAGGIADAVQELANQFAGLEDINPGRVVQALLTPLADMAIKAGEIIAAEGIATIAARDALESFGATGWGAVLAGTALMAAGAAAKSGLAALASSNGMATTSASYGGSTGSVGSDLQTIQTELTVYVTGRISGSDILLSGQKTQNNLNR